MTAVIETRESMLSCGICDGPQVIDIYEDNHARHRCLTDREHTDWRWNL